MQPSITTRCQTFESQIEEILSRILEAIYFSQCVRHTKMKQYPFKLIVSYCFLTCVYLCKCGFTLLFNNYDIFFLTWL